MPAKSKALEIPPEIDHKIDKTVPLKTLVELRFQGKSNPEIAKMFGISRQAVHQRLSGFLANLDAGKLEAYRKNRVALFEYIEATLLSELVNPDRVKKATLGNVAYALTQVHQARRLEAGESTQNLGLHALVEKYERGESPTAPARMKRK